MAKDHKARRSMVKKGYYTRQFIRTDRNKARRLTRRVQKKKKWANDRQLADQNFVRLLRKHDRRLARKNVRRAAWRAKMKALKEARAQHPETKKAAAVHTNSV